MKFNTSTGYAIGGFFDLKLPRNEGRLSINNELLLVNQLSTGVYKHSYKQLRDSFDFTYDRRFDSIERRILDSYR